GLGRFVADQTDFAEEIGNFHAAEGFEERGNLRGDAGDVTGELVGSGGVTIAGGNDGDFVHLAERFAEGADDFRQTGDELVHDGGLVVLLEGFGLNVHGAGLGVALLENDFGFGFTLCANRGSLALGFGNQALALGAGKRLDALALDFRLFQDGGDEFAFAANDFGVLNFYLGFALDLLNADLFEYDGLLLAIGLDFIGLVGLRLGLLAGFQVVGLLDVEVTCGFGLLGHRCGFGGDTLLIRLRLGDGGGARGFGALDSDVAIGFGGGDFGVALDAGDVRAAHVGDVLVFVADFLQGEADDFKAHLAHVVGAGGAHAVADHFRLLDDLLDGELADDAAKVTFHDQADEAIALRGRFRKELFGGGENGFLVILHLDLRHGFHGDRDALLGVEILLRSDVEGHQLQREILAGLHHGENDRAPPGVDIRAAEAIDDQRFVRSSLAIHPGDDRHEHQRDDDQDSRPNHHIHRQPQHNDLLFSNRSERSVCISVQKLTISQNRPSASRKRCPSRSARSRPRRLFRLPCHLRC